MITQARSLKKPSGGRKRRIGKKKMKNIGRVPAHTRLGENKVTIKRVRGDNQKVQLQLSNVANVLDPKTKKFKKVKIKAITDNPANRNFVRRNIITKGTVIDTEMGKAKVTSRPGQDGVVNATLM